MHHSVMHDKADLKQHSYLWFRNAIAAEMVLVCLDTNRYDCRHSGQAPSTCHQRSEAEQGAGSVDVNQVSASV